MRAIGINCERLFIVCTRHLFFAVGQMNLGADGAALGLDAVVHVPEDQRVEARPAQLVAAQRNERATTWAPLLPASG